MVANGSEPREILLDPMIAGSRGTDGCVFDREVDRECSPRVDSLDMMGVVCVLLFASEVPRYPQLNTSQPKIARLVLP